MSNKLISIPKPTLERIVKYLNYLNSTDGETVNISSTAIAEALDLNPVQVRKDLASVAEGGKPKTGYVKKDLIDAIEKYLGYNDTSDAVIVGVGNLGKAFLHYENFGKSGLNIIAGFDSNDKVVGSVINGKQVFDIARLSELCQRLKVKMAILTLPAAHAQATANTLIKAGIRAIWNFTPAHLSVPDNVVVKNENMVASFAVLSKMLTESFEKYGIE